MKHTLKSILAIAALSTPAFANAPRPLSFEACTVEGPCAIQVTLQESREVVWLVTAENEQLMSVWSGAPYLVVDSDVYDDVSHMLPDEQKLTLPGENPTTGQVMRKGGKGQAVRPVGPGGNYTGGSAGGGGGGGSLVGNVTVTVGGSDPCSACHTGSMKEIHKDVLPKDK